MLHQGHRFDCCEKSEHIYLGSSVFVFIQSLYHFIVFGTNGVI